MKVTIIFTTTLFLSVAEELPSFLHVCRKNEPNMEECIIASGEALKEHLAKGVPEYGIPSVEPLVIEKLICEESGGLRITAGDVKAWGGSDYHFKTVSLDVDQQLYKMDVELPMLRIESHYNVSGKLIMMPVKGDGPMYANVTDLKSKITMKGNFYEKDGKRYLKYTNMTIKTSVGGGSVKLENLFNGDKMLNEIVNDALNKNLDGFLRELMPIVERALAQSVLTIANRIVERFTFDQLFPE